MKHARIKGIGTAVPPYQVTQSEVRDIMAAHFDGQQDELERLLSVFSNAGIRSRYLAQPLDWYREEHSFAEANRCFEERAIELGVTSAQHVLQSTQLDSQDVNLLIVVSSTGIAAPSIDVGIAQTLGLSPHINRIPIWGLGCSGGVAGIQQAANLACAQAGQNVLLIAVELCSLTFQHRDFSKSSLVGTSLFSDGAAAVLLNTDGSGPRVLGGHSTLFKDSEAVMGWDVVDTGLKLRFSPDIPVIVHEELPQLFGQACEQWQLTRPQIRHFILHPGGPKILEAYAHVLDLTEEQLAPATQILAEYGNMSSPSVIFVLDRLWQHRPANGDYGVMMSMGPGFSANQLLLQW